MFAASLIAAVFVFGHVALPSPPSQAQNTIEGRVTAVDHRPLDNVRVVLQSDTYSQLSMTYTDGSGRFRFQGLASGNYYVVVEPGQYDYERQTQRVEANPFNTRRSIGGQVAGGEIFRVDFLLRPRRINRDDIVATRGKGSVVFSQDVPDGAKKKYLSGVECFEKDDYKGGVDWLNQAIELFADYYDALELLGTEYVKHKEYATALPLLLHAVDLNKDGWRGYYSLGIAQLESRNREEGISSLRRAAELNPESANVYLRLGLALAPNDSARSEAIGALRYAARLAGKKYPDVYYQLALLYNKSGKYRESADALESYLQAIPDKDEQKPQREQIRKVIKQLRKKASESSHKSDSLQHPAQKSALGFLRNSRPVP